MGKETKLLKSDVLAALTIGILASIFLIPVIKNLGLKIPYIFAALFFIPFCIIGIYGGHFLGKKIRVIWQFVKFGEAGGLNFLVDFGVLNLLILIFGISTGIFYSVFKGISFILSVTNSYFWNKFWVFREVEEEGKIKIPQSKGEFMRFLMVTLIGLAINVGLASLIVYLSSLGNPTATWERYWANIGAAGGSLLAMMWNFIGYKFWAFKK